MFVERWGSLRYRGSTVLMDVPLKPNTPGSSWYDHNVRWDAQHKDVQLTPRYVPYTYGITHHDYSIRLSLDDVSALFKVLGQAASSIDADALRDVLAKEMPELAKMMVCGQGYRAVPLPERPAAAAPASAPAIG